MARSPSQSTGSLRDARVVVTGASGFIGRHLCRALRAERAQLVVFQRRPRPLAGGARYLTLDATDRKAAQSALLDVRPDCVFHLAGFVSGDRGRQAMVEAFDANVVATANLLLTCLTRLPDTRVITTSSLEASNPFHGPAITGSPYGVSKLMLEVMSGSLHALYGAPLLTARLGMVYGPDDPNEDRVVPTIIAAFLQGRSPHLSSGQRRSDWVYVDDVSRALIALAKVRTLVEPALDLGTGELHSVREVAETIAELMRAPQPIRYDPDLDRPYEQERRAQLAQTRRALALPAPTTLRSGLTQTVAWYRANLRRVDRWPEVP